MSHPPVAAGLATPHPWVAQRDPAVRFGIASGLRKDWPMLRDFVQGVEGLGFDSCWTADHPMLGRECWTTLGAAGLVTRRLRLGSLVSCLAYRPPALLARLAADVDHLSGGRAVLGVGVGDIGSSPPGVLGGRFHPAEGARRGAPDHPLGDRFPAAPVQDRVAPPWRQVG